MRNDPKRPKPVQGPKAEDYDRVDADEDGAAQYEPAYRDGSAKNECWGETP